MSILIKNAFIITMDKERRVLENTQILIEGNRIKEIDENIDVSDANIDKVIDAKGKIVMPGLINGHSHYEQSFMKGITRLFTGGTSSWIKNFKMPITQEFLKEDYYYSNLLTSIEMISNGVTCGVNSICQQDPKKMMDYGIEMSAKAVEESGLRTLLAVGVADKFEEAEFLVDTEEAKDIIETSIQQWNNTADGRIKVWAGPAGLFSTTGNLWKSIKKVVDKYDVGIHTHIGSFRVGEVEEAKEYGFLGPNVTGAHGVWLSPKDIEIIADTGMNLVHNPTYKLGYSVDGKVEKFGDAIAPITELQNKGVTVALGQDGCMGDTQDLFKEMRCLAFTQQYKMIDKSIFPPTRLLEMQTIDCAKTMLWDDEIGSLEVGKKADIIIINTGKIDFFPKLNLIANLVYMGNGYDVEDVIIDGNIVMENREIKTVNVNEILGEAQQSFEKLIKRADLSHLKNYTCDPWLTKLKS